MNMKNITRKVIMIGDVVNILIHIVMKLNLTDFVRGERRSNVYEDCYSSLGNMSSIRCME